MIRHSGWPLTALTALATGLVLWAPLPFGGNVAWAEASLRVLAFAALAVAAVTVDRRDRLAPAAWAAAALAALALLGVLQAVPWTGAGAAVAGRLSPEHARLWGEAAGLGSHLDLLGQAEAGEAGAVAAGNLGPGGEIRLTVAASASRSAALSWAAAAACLLVGAAAGAGRAGRVRRRWLAGALLAGALFQVLYGARGWFARSEAIWGVAVPGSPGRLRGTFVNANHLALFLGMALPVAFAWGWWAARRAALEPRPERRILLLAPPALLWLTLFAGLAFTNSRGGLLAALAAVLFQGLLIVLGGGAGEEAGESGLRRWWRAAAGAAAALAGLGMVAAFGWQQGLGRLLATSASEVSLSARRATWAATLELWGRFPLLGSGLGTFREAFPLVQPPGLRGNWWQAHSGPLELLATAGLLGAALALLAAALLLRRLARVMRRGSRSEDRAAALAALGAFAAVAVHEAVDFGLSLPGNFTVLAVLLGAGAAARVRASAGSEQADRPRHDPPALEAADLQEVEAAAGRPPVKPKRARPSSPSRRRRRR